MSILGHTVKSRMTVICATCLKGHVAIVGWRTVRLEEMGRYQEDIFRISFAGAVKCRRF